METVTLNIINENLKCMRKEIAEMREHMVDIDSIMTRDDRAALQEARNELKKNKAITLEEFERQLNI
jgi:hypothetical protein